MNTNIEMIKEMWNEASDYWYKKNTTDFIMKKVMNDYSYAFHSTVFNMIQKQIGDLKGKKILVPSSGDNIAAFAFCLMGASVVSTDIAVKQMENAEAIAKSKNWDISFYTQNTMTLDKFDNNEFDFVYTSNGVHVWIDDLNLMYQNISRVLKPNGKHILFEMHPFTRPFEFSLDNDLSKDVIITKPYTDINCMYNKEIKTYHWRLQDYINAFIHADLNIRGFEEMLPEESLYWISDEEREKISPELYSNLNNWKYNKLSAIPQMMCICVEKNNL